MSTYTWTITDESNNKASLRFTPPVTGSPVYDFCNIRIGDNLVILGPEFSAGNRGSFSVLSVSVATRTITYNNPSATSETVNLPTVAGSLDKVTFWRAPVSTVYDCNNPAYVTTEPNTVNGIPCRKSKVSLPVSTDIVVRDSSNGAYLSKPEEAPVTALSRLPDGTTTFTATGYTKTSGHVEITGFLPKFVETSDLTLTTGSPVSPSGGVGETASSQFSHAFKDTFYKGCGGVAVTDLKQAVAVFGGRDIETSTDIHKVSVYTPGNTVKGSQQELSRLYTWVDSSYAEVCGTGASAVVLDHPRFWNKILVVGGYPLGPDHATGAGFTQTAAYLYSIDDDTLEETGNDPAPWPADCALAWTGEYAVAISGQLYDGSLSTYVSVWDPAYATDFDLGHWYMSDENFISVGRANAQAVALNNGKVLLIGGRKLVDSNTFSPDNIGTPIASCELITPDPDFATATVRTGPMTYGRFAFGTVKLPDGRVLVIGGIGCKPCQPVVTIGLQYVNELSSCEIYDPSLGIWSPIPDTLDTHSYCTCGYDANTNRVYVVGGAASKKVEYLDLNTMTWHYSVAELSNNSYRGCGSMVGHIEGDPVAYPYLLRVGGSYLNNLYQEKNDYQTFSIQIYNEVARGNGINGVHKITASNTFTTNTGWTKSSSNSFVTTVTAQEASIKGPYLYDKTQIFAVNGITLTSETIIPQGRGCPLLTITEDISDIPLEGFFVANFGRKTQVGPIKYTKIGSKIQPDPHFDFPEELLTSTLSLVTKGAYVPTIDQQRGAFYLTASNAGLDAARQYVTDISAGGIDLDIEVRYPGDRGLGDEGNPAKGSHKLSDVIEVFGPDNLDDFLEEARNGQ